jgi:hypothetical protein
VVETVKYLSGGGWENDALPNVHMANLKQWLRGSDLR